MDRRSWLWRRKSSEKSPGETESSGSISSHSERFSDEQEVLKASPNHESSHSPEALSKEGSGPEEVNDKVRHLSEKLSAALSNISSKEDLVKQHAKVAEEAVSGWERAENEVLLLKRQLESANRKNSSLEDRVSHLDGALKECVRQLRQSREEQDRKIQEGIANKTLEIESTKSKLESHILELQLQLETIKAESERENSALKMELHSQAKELHSMIIERDLSTQAAESASKLHLESIKKVAKFEAECRRLKSTTRHKTLSSPSNDHKTFTASSICVESLTDSQSDSGEIVNHSDSWVSAVGNEKGVNGRNPVVPSADINLMDDFLEMERLAALPETETGSSCIETKSGSSCIETKTVSDRSNGEESPFKAELEAMINRTADLEERLEKMEAEKVELEMALKECQDQLGKSQSQHKEGEMKLIELQSQLSLANKSKQAVERDLDGIKEKKKKSESELLVAESEIKTLISKVSLLEKEVKRERALSEEAAASCRKLEDELSKMKNEAEIRNMASLNEELKIKQEKELAVAASKLAECQKTIASLGRQLNSLATLEDFLTESEKPLELNNEGSRIIPIDIW